MSDVIQNRTILFISHYPSMYGANQSLFRLMLELRAHYSIRPVVLLPSRGEICKLLENNHIKYHISHYYWWVNDNKGFFQKVLNIRKQLRNTHRINQICKIVSSEKIDLIYTNSVTINIGYYLSKKLNLPHIWHIRESMGSYQFKFSLGKYYAKKLFEKGADQYILISKFLNRSYERYLPGHKTRIVYNGIDVDSFSKESSKQTDVFDICLVGVVSEQKNQLDACKAINILVNEKGIANIKLHLIGSANKNYLRIIEDFVSSNKLSEKVVFHGHQSDISSLLKEMNLGLMCARDEAFGRVTIEYMLNRMPVIASNSGANKELVHPGLNGELYELNNSTELAEKISNYINSPSLIYSTGDSAREFAIQNFSSRKNSKEILNLIEELLVKNKK